MRATKAAPLSDFVVTRTRRPPGELSGILQRFVHAVPGTMLEVHGPWGSLALARAPHEPDALHQDDAGITVVVGSPVARFPGLPPRLIHDGPRRRLLHERAMRGEPVAAELDGAFAVLSIDTATGAHRLVTDRFAFIPLFHGSGVTGTHVDAVARAAGAQDDLDAVSVVDLVANLSCTPPHTMYRGIEQVPAATEDGREYWTPAERDSFTRIDDAATALRDGLVEGVHAAIGDASEVGVLLSGGEDSRAVMGALPPHVTAHGFTYADWRSREVRIAQRVATAYGATHEVGLRRPDHYARGFDATAALLGSHHSFIDVHGLGLYDHLGIDRLPLTIGGLSADSLLKRVYAEDEAAPWRSPRLAGIDEALCAAVDERRVAFREQLARVRPQTSKEWLWLWPMALRRHGGNVDGNRRMFRTWEAFHATAVLDVAAAVPAEWKERRRLYRAAARPLLARSRWVPHAEYRYPYFGPVMSAALLPGLALARGVRAVLHGEVRARHRPWPKWRTVANSALMLERERALLSASPLADALGIEPAASTRWYALHRVFFTQLAYAQSLAAG